MSQFLYYIKHRKTNTYLYKKEKYLEKEKNYLFLAKILNPLVLITYGILCFYLYSLSQFCLQQPSWPV